MFQRHTKTRQAGFIRKFDLSKGSSVELNRKECTHIHESTNQFSPFKDQSPQPIQKILQLHQQSHINRVKLIQQKYEMERQKGYQFLKKEAEERRKQKKRRNNSQNMNLNIKQQQQLNDFHDFFKQKYEREPKKSKITKQVQRQATYERFETVEESRKYRAAIITESIEQVQYIQSQPEQINLSLAQSFNLHCHKMKQRLERERIKFSKSRQKAKRQLSQSFDEIKAIKKKSSYETNDTRIQNNHYENKRRPPLQPTKIQHKPSQLEHRKKLQLMEFSDQYKQNYDQNTNLNRTGFKTARPSMEGQGTKFFIPASSSRSKPITPRQAYQHSLKKWKQLPEVVAKQKQKQKQAQMRERITKMKAHSIEVRRKLKR